MKKDPANPIVTSNPGVSNERHNPDHLKPQYYYPDSARCRNQGMGAMWKHRMGSVSGSTFSPAFCTRSCTLYIGQRNGASEDAVDRRTAGCGWRMAAIWQRSTVPESALPQCPLPGIPEFDDFDAPSLGNWYYAPRMMPQTFADVTAGGYVRLRGQEARTLLNRVSILARKLTSLHVRITTKMEFHPVVYQHSAGLILYYDNMNYINLRKYYSETLGQGALSIDSSGKWGENGIHRYPYT